MSYKSRESKVKYGIDWELEEQAMEILMNDRKSRNVTKHSEKQDWFSYGQMYRRKSREIITTSGVPEKGIVSGMFKRAYNPNMRKSTRNDEMS